MSWQRRAAERIGRMACSCDDDACIATYAERIIREEAGSDPVVPTGTVDALAEAVALLRRFEAGDKYFAADCRAFLTRHGGER